MNVEKEYDKQFQRTGNEIAAAILVLSKTIESSATNTIDVRIAPDGDKFPIDVNVGTDRYTEAVRVVKL